MSRPWGGCAWRGKGHIQNGNLDQRQPGGWRGGGDGNGTGSGCGFLAGAARLAPPPPGCSAGGIFAGRDWTPALSSPVAKSAAGIRKMRARSGPCVRTRAPRLGTRMRRLCPPGGLGDIRSVDTGPGPVSPRSAAPSPCGFHVGIAGLGADGPPCPRSGAFRTELRTCLAFPPNCAQPEKVTIQFWAAEWP